MEHETNNEREKKNRVALMSREGTLGIPGIRAKGPRQGACARNDAFVEVSGMDFKGWLEGKKTNLAALERERGTDY